MDPAPFKDFRVLGPRFPLSLRSPAALHPELSIKLMLYKLSSQDSPSQFHIFNWLWQGQWLLKLSVQLQAWLSLNTQEK